MSSSGRRQHTRNHRTRIVLDTLLKRLLQEQTGVLDDGHFSLGGQNGITHIVQYDFEKLCPLSCGSTFQPEILFEPVLIDEVRQCRNHPFSMRPFFDLPEDPETITTADRTGQLWSIESYLEPDTEGDTVLPHITMLGLQPKDGRENAILYGELIALVSAMRNRAFQPKVDTEEEQEALEEADDEDRKSYPYLFTEEDTFPVLFLSAVAPRHARIFYGCMEGRQLVIRQSKLYSFVRVADAPIELFASLRLSRPLVRCP
ncbi:hypothetical protein ASPACDRAFT_64722 [Aspergillus aculeatus ATCC 16872]|uniref:Uncharacterized protein n=1 Tax=Aspergillus aculeatus (strain ATCC 16872 / CBS 172.66 / WB 5094) TaxID=690307 RepID=A0A1L9WG26_ASPA1|nr:uncharacterized protein ASPACDRAFT_64722 [Aspergillus aculeatus ATCC 16872]OJJ95122.1 hypothetical protein ASPACDRAFT_64722 [Aspergillus aculeatus ATCC 16872]